MSTCAKAVGQRKESPSAQRAVASVLQRAAVKSECKCQACAKEKRLLQRSAVSEHMPDEVPGIVYEVLGTPGRPLDDTTRGFMEDRFGHDFSSVRVHTDTRAAESARAIGARAYAVGSDLVFGIGEYRPTSSSGKALMAHELAHTLQQFAHSHRPYTSIQIDDPNSRFEVEADQIGNGILTGEFRAPRMRGEARMARRTMGPRTKPIVPTPQDSVPPTEDISDKASIEAGLVALGQLLTKAGDAIEPFRAMYNEGANIIAEKALEFRRSGLSEVEIAKQVSEMRTQLGYRVRNVSGDLQKKGAELIDWGRGRGKARPTYDMLHAAGKSDADIIASASRTNKLVNALPTGLRRAGKASWITAGGISVYIILDAPPEKRKSVAAQEVGGLAGGAIGLIGAEAGCVFFGLASGGIGLMICGLLGGLIGMEVGRQVVRANHPELRRQAPRLIRAMRTSPAGIDELISHEKIVPYPYLDLKRIWTFGIGHTAAAGGLDPEQLPRGVEQPMALVLETFRSDLQKFEGQVSAAVSVPLTQNEFDALVSFQFNTGGISKAKLTQHLNHGDKAGAARGFMGWVKDKELIPRRQKEQALFRDGTYSGERAIVYPADAKGRVLWSKGKTR